MTPTPSLSDEKLARDLEVFLSPLAKQATACGEGVPNDHSLYINLGKLRKARALYNRLTALSLREGPSDAMRVALEKCRDKFREYERLHLAKVRSDRTADVFFQQARTAFNAEARGKAARNREMAEMCEAALASSLPRVSIADETPTDVGRVPVGTGLSQAEPQEGLGPSGFDPSRDAVCRAARRLVACNGAFERSGAFDALRSAVATLDGRDEALDALEDLRRFLAQTFDGASMATHKAAGDKFSRLESAIGAMRAENIELRGWR